MNPTCTIKAIETSYAGCRFRSRLEARWAVFFDTLGAKWQYEPQGYMIGDRPYLPDFWLPDARLWVEVKGVMTSSDLGLLIGAAGWHGLPHEPGSDLQGEKLAQAFGAMYQDRLLILGEVPDPKFMPRHIRLDVVGRHVFAAAAAIGTGADGPLRTFLMTQKPVLATAMLATEDEPFPAEMFNGTRYASDLPPLPRLAAAYRTARSARFEHGQTG